MKRIFITSATLLLFVFGFAQAPITVVSKSNVALKYGESITSEDLKEDLTILASDALEGRETGKRGQKMAAAYIESTFRDLGLNPPVTKGDSKSYLQDVKLKSTKPGEIYLRSGNEIFKNIEGGIVYSGGGQNTAEISTEVVFAGKGTDAEFAGLDVKNKGVLVINADRMGARNASKTAYDKGANMVFVVNQESDEKYEEYLKKYAHYFTRESLGLVKEDGTGSNGMFYVSPSVASKISGNSFEKLNKSLESFEKGKGNAYGKLKLGKVTYKLGVDKREVISENILGYMEGTDLKDELVIITAHYDHVGVIDGEIYNGADDDGSGTVALLEIAEAFSKAKDEGNGPRRSVLFMPVTGEEKGLLGSAYFV